MEQLKALIDEDPSLISAEGDWDLNLITFWTPRRPQIHSDARQEKARLKSVL